MVAVIMNKTCKYCGIVPEDHICPYKRKKYNKYSKDKAQDKFRNTAAWQKKREYIKRRDRYLCQVCITGLFDTLNELTYQDLEVHHILPIEEDYNRRLDDDNLITICSYHHKMAESGKISREFLQSRVYADR